MSAAAAVPVAPATPETAEAGGTVLDFLALVQSLGCAAPGSQASAGSQQRPADVSSMFGEVEEPANKKEEKGEKKQTHEQEAAPMMLFLPTPVAPPPAPITATLAIPANNAGDNPDGELAAEPAETPEQPLPVAAAATPTPGGAVVSAVPDKGAEGQKQANAPLPAPEETRFALPDDDGPYRGGSLAFAARVEKRTETPVRPLEAEPQRRATDATGAQRTAMATQQKAPAAEKVQVAPAENTMPAHVPDNAPAVDTGLQPAPAAIEHREPAAQQHRTDADALKPEIPVRGEASASMADDGERRPTPVKAADAGSRERNAKHGEREPERTGVPAAEAGSAPAKHEFQYAAQTASVHAPDAAAQPGGPRPLNGERTAAAETAPAAAPVSAEAPDTRTAGAAREISLKVSTPSANGVELKIVERGGEVQVAVRTPDRELAQSLREHLGDLSRSLDDRGYNSETWHPAAAQASSSGDTARDSHSGGNAYENLRDSWSGQSGSGHHGGDGRRRQPQQPAWLEELQQHTGGETPSEFRSYLK